MFRLATLWVTLTCFGFLLPGLHSAEDLKKEARDRLDEYLAKMHEIRSDYHVLGRLVCLEKPIGGALENVSYSQTLFRKIQGVYQGQPSCRFEMTVSDPIRQGGTRSFEHNLFTSKRVLHGWDLRLGGSVREFDSPYAARMDPLARIDPFTVACNSTRIGQSYLEQSEEMLNDIAIYEAEKLRGGRLRCWAVHKRGLAVIEFTFKYRPQWMIESARSFMNPGEPINYLEADKSTVRDWKEFAHSSTVWKQIDEKTWLPEAFVSWQSHEKSEEDVELLLRDWKLGDNVPLSLLDEKSFSSEAAIASNIDFEAIEQIFLRSAKAR